MAINLSLRSLSSPTPRCVRVLGYLSTLCEAPIHDENFRVLLKKLSRKKGTFQNLTAPPLRHGSFAAPSGRP